MSKTTFEKLGIPYEEKDGIFYPVRFGELEERANEVNETAYELLDDIEAKWLKKHKPKNPNSFTEQLQLRTQTRMMAEEIVIRDVVMQFH